MPSRRIAFGGAGGDRTRQTYAWEFVTSHNCYRVMRVCLHCTKELPSTPRWKSRNRFCGHKCAASYPRPHRYKYRCKTCAAPVSYGLKYCNADCRAKRPSARPETTRNDKTRKRALIADFGHHCSVCTLSEWMGKQIPIEVDHIDGNSDNNELVNLRLICPNCHAQTPTYKGKNIGRAGSRGQKRMEKYLQKVASERIELSPTG